MGKTLYKLEVHNLLAIQSLQKFENVCQIPISQLHSTYKKSSKIK
jgi:hypothetical protein